MVEPDIDLPAWRLRSHGLADPRFTEVGEVVGWLGAVQSQEYAVAKWSVGQRATGLRDAGLDLSLAEGTILRTHVLRPTWHFVAAADLRWMLALTAPRVHAANAHYYRRFELDPAVLVRGTELVARALAGGQQLTRKELAQVVAAGGIEAEPLRLGLLLMYAELEAVICSGGLRGRQRTYALLDERVPPAPPRDRDEALADLTRRYFTSHGPATRADYQWWSGLTAADAKAGLALTGADLGTVERDGQTYWHALGPPGRTAGPGRHARAQPSATPAGGRPEPSPTAHLLQGFDEYVVGYAGGRGSFERAGLAADGRDWASLHAIILDGRLVAGWRRRLTGAQLGIEVRPLRPLEPAELAAVRRAADRYAEFVGVPASLTVAGASDA